jgi:peptidoglycan/xylan/chitin deacetylase (PgdA/CDA1 family)
VTFFVSNFASLDQSEIDKLKILQADGHEIAFHGLNHADEVAYIQDNSLSEYMNNEIISGINLMKSKGFNPVDFAYPFGSDDPDAREALAGYFLHMRDTYYDWDDTIFYEYGSNTPYIAGIGIDDNTYGNDLSDIRTGILKAMADDRILIFYCHEPVSSSPGEYQTSYARLEYIFQTVQDNGMKTYTVAEIN